MHAGDRNEGESVMGAMVECTGACGAGQEFCNCCHRAPWLDPLMRMGWVCPVCHKGNAPDADKCGHCV